MTSRRPLLSVVIPVYNEAPTVEELLQRVQAVPLDKELIIVDDGSRDGTRAILERLPESAAKVLLHDRNRGKGAALRTGFAIASGEVVVVQDADLEYNPEEFAKLIEPIVAGRADVVYGVRFTPPYARPYRWALFVNSILTFVSNFFSGLNLTDEATCYKMFRREILQQIELKEDRFGFDPEFTAKIAGLPLRVMEIPVGYVRRSYREGKKIGLRDGFRALWCMVRYAPRARRATRV